VAMGAEVVMVAGTVGFPLNRTIVEFVTEALLKF